MKVISNIQSVSENKLCMKMYQKGHKTQKKRVKISKIRSKQVIFTVWLSKARILRRLWKILCRHASMCLPLLEALQSVSCKSAGLLRSRLSLVLVTFGTVITTVCNDPCNICGSGQCIIYPVQCTVYLGNFSFKPWVPIS